MSYNEFFKAELAKGANEIQAGELARAKFAIQNTRRTKGRNINDSHYAGAINIR